MIKSFRCKETEKIFQRSFSRKLPQTIQKTAYRKLALLHSAKELRDLLLPPANCLEMLHGDREGQSSIRINAQWRLCFARLGNDAYDVEIVDYHQEGVL